jgi:hypothetical protein
LTTVPSDIVTLRVLANHEYRMFRTWTEYQQAMAAHQQAMAEIRSRSFIERVEVLGPYVLVAIGLVMVALGWVSSQAVVWILGLVLGSGGTATKVALTRKRPNSINQSSS